MANHVLDCGQSGFKLQFLFGHSGSTERPIVELQVSRGFP
ncbi:hypothetical protein SAMCCGM7_pC0870 (plasmid) [Sinorhizobium americanum CCGM7]|nr:hypothetical protein SAMCCGM7_pC0870 [Sinorhizobium americanum CCGM7]